MGEYNVINGIPDSIHLQKNEPIFLIKKKKPRNKEEGTPSDAYVTNCVKNGGTYWGYDDTKEEFGQEVMAIIGR
jgi:hypothetical protein